MASRAINQGPYRLRTVGDTPWGTPYGYGRKVSLGRKAGAGLAVVGRMVFPVLALMACVAAIYLYRDMPVRLFGISWLSAAHLLVGIGFFCVFLTNRRYGPACAFAQVVVTSLLVVGALVFGKDTLGAAFPLATIPSVREAAAFGAAFFGASFVSIVVFDGARGPYWWAAPLLGFLSTAIIFPLLFFPAAFAGTGAPWIGHTFVFIGVLAGEGIALLVPFWILRSMVPPAGGLGGY